MTDYITLAEFKDRVGSSSAVKDVRILEHIAAASRKIDAICHRTFGAHDGAATARYFRPTGCDTVWIDDASEITTVEVDDADTGSYATSWATTDYETDPANGIGPNGLAGWPVTTLRAVGTLWFPTCNRRRPIKVTAKWGWTAVPDAVKEAAYLLTNRLSYEVAVPGGVTAPNVDFGVPGSALQRPYTAEGLLKPYMRHDTTIGVA